MRDRPWISLHVVELLVVGAITPVLMFPSGRWPWLALAVPIVWLAYRMKGSPLVPRTPLDPAIAAIGLMSVLSTLVAFDPASAAPKLAGVGLGIAVYVALVRFADSQSRLAWFWAAYIAAGFILAVVLLVGTEWIDKWPWAATVTAQLPTLIRGVPGAETGFQPNAGAGALLLFVPAAAWIPFVRSCSPTARVLAGAAASVMFATLVLTQSRTAILGILFGAVVLGLVKASRKWRWVSVGVLVVTIGMASVRFDTIVRTAGAYVGPNFESGLGGRIELWLRTVDLIHDHPLAGVGFNGLRQLIQVEQPMFLMRPFEDPAHAHNHLLQAGADLGVPGLVAYLALWFGVLALLYRAACRNRNWKSSLGWGLMLGMICHFGFGLGDAIPLGTKVGVTFWLALALAAATDRMSATVTARE